MNDFLELRELEKECFFFVFVSLLLIWMDWLIKNYIFFVFVFQNLNNYKEIKIKFELKLILSFWRTFFFR